MRILLLLWSSFLISTIISAQSKSVNGLEVTQSKALKLGKVNVRENINQYATTDKYKKQLAKQQKQRPDNFIGRKAGQKIVRPELEHQGVDRIRQASSRSLNTVVEPLVNVAGIDIGGSPHDPSGDIGKDHYVQGINVTEIGVYDKAGNLLERFAANVLWQPLGFTSAGDPIILYDQEFDIWYITEFPNGNELLVAVSETSDPLGDYNVYNFSTPNFPDYPKYALWDNALTVTTNELGGSQLDLYVLDRAALVEGEDEVAMQRILLPGSINTEAGFYVATPVDWTGDQKPTPGTGPYFIRLNDSSWGEVAQDQVEIYEVAIDFSDPNGTTFTNLGVPLSPFDSNPCAAEGFGFSCIPQPFGIGLDGIPEVIMNQAHYRNFGSHQSMIFNFITDVTDGDNLSGIRWVELRKTATSDWALYQEGTFAPDDGLHRYMGAMCMDGSGNIGLAYNVSSEDEFVGVRFTGRRASDPLGMMTVEEYNVVSGESTLNSGGRFGDYSQMGVDPENDRTFWYTGEYANAAGTGTRVLAFELNKDTNDILPSLVISPQSTPELEEETLTVAILNAGLEAQSEFKLGFQFDDGPIVEEDIVFDLMPDSTYVHSFGTDINFDERRDYDLMVYTDLASDDTRGNDTLRTILTKYNYRDIEAVSLLYEGGQVCSPEIELTLTYMNNGFESIDTIIADITLDGILIESRELTTPLDLGQSATEMIIVNNLQAGANEIEVILSPKGQVDDVIDNNGVSSSVNYSEDGQDWTLTLSFDDFPEETSWVILSEGGSTIASGGGYSEINGTEVVSFCTFPDSCYTFTILDSYGDGIGGIFGDPGNYQITDQFGNVIASLLDVDFGNSETNDFCGLTSCALDALVNVSPVSTQGASDGVILISLINGAGPFMYSIDGGQTFEQDNTFTNLSPGDYDVVVTGAAGCLFEATATIVTCQLEAIIDVQNATTSSSNDGSISINVDNANGLLMYSIDGGITFETSNLFEGIAAGDYEIVIVDGDNCFITQSVVVDFNTSIESFLLGISVSVSPNPTDGLMNIKVAGMNTPEQKIYADIFDLHGKKLRKVSLYKYGSDYLGQGSLTALPSGTYLVRINHPDVSRMYRIIKT